MKDKQAQIREVRIQLENIRRAERYLQELERQRKIQLAKLERLGKALDQEQREMEALEQWSIKELFVKVIDKKEQLAKEKEEYLQAMITFRDAQKELEMIDFEISVLREKAGNADALATQLRQLYAYREAEILNQDEHHPLKALLEKLARWNQIDRELEEAVTHGGNVQQLLETVSQHLIQAKRWFNNPLRDHRYQLRMITEEIDTARLRMPKLRLEFVKFDQEIKEALTYPELEDWQHDQWRGIQQVQQLTAELNQFTQGFLQQIMPSRQLPYQLHQTHTLADNLRHQMETSVKWLRLEQEKIRREIDTLEEQKHEMLS